MMQTNDNAIQTPQASIVIPACNRADVLSRCLAALARQSFRHFEIIVIDDASTDETPDVIQAFDPQRADIRVIRLRNDAHAGANPSRNRGIAAASGELVAFLDCDCIAQEDWLERLVVPFQNDDHGNVAGVTGLVEDAPPKSLFDTTFKGTHRIHGAGDASRLIAGNMCFRRNLLRKYRLDEDRAEKLQTADGTPDVTVSGRGDEEGLHLILRAAGYALKAVPDAVVLHEHHLSGRAFFRQAWRGGRSAARLVYKFRLKQRIDMIPFICALLTLPMGLVWRPLLVIPTFCYLMGLAAIAYNDLFRKRKSLVETAVTFPLLVAYYMTRLAGYLYETLRLRLTRHDIRRVRLADYAAD